MRLILFGTALENPAGVLEDTPQGVAFADSPSFRRRLKRALPLLIGQSRIDSLFAVAAVRHTLVILCIPQYLMQ